MELDGSQNHPKAESPEGLASAKPVAAYIKEVRACLKNGQRKQAYTIVLQALALFPDHALLLSYCGWLQAVVDRKHHSGITTCRKAFVTFKSSDPHTAGIVFPILYLNLGRAFLVAGKKKEAVENFIKGLKHDRSNIELKKEMKLLGTRKDPFLPFLSRSNPINKYIGKLRNDSSRSRVLSI